MSEELMITQQDLIDWIDRPPSNDDLDLARFIATRLEKFYDLENQLQQIEEYQKALDEITSEKIDLENIIKEVRKWLNKTIFYFDFEKEVTSHAFDLLYTAQGQELLRILDKGE